MAVETLYQERDKDNLFGTVITATMPAGLIRRLFDWLRLTKKVTVLVQFGAYYPPCDNCLKEIVWLLRELYGGVPVRDYEDVEHPEEHMRGWCLVMQTPIREKSKPYWLAWSFEEVRKMVSHKLYVCRIKEKHPANRR